jgi:hypothetical protein
MNNMFYIHSSICPIRQGTLRLQLRQQFTTSPTMAFSFQQNPSNSQIQHYSVAGGEEDMLSIHIVASSWSAFL